MPANNKRAVQVNEYSDADYENDQTTRKSITGILTTVNGAPVQWLAKQQPVVAKSTCEAEYIAAAESTTVTLWLHNLLKEARLPTESPTLHVDNTAAVQVANNTGATRRRKCIDVSYHYLHDRVQKGELKILRIPTTQQYAEIFTKPLKATLYQRHKNNIQIRKPPTKGTAALASGECGSIQNPQQTLGQLHRNQTTHGSIQSQTSSARRIKHSLTAHHLVGQ